MAEGAVDSKDQAGSSQAELQSELAVIVAYTQDEYIRKHGTEHGVAQEVAKAILAAGFTKLEATD